MATTAQHIAARSDADLFERLVATAELAGIPDAATFVTANIGRLVAVQVTVGGQATSITDTHAYAADVRAQYLAASQALPPGLNPGAVTDPILAAAVAEVQAP